MNLSSMPPPPRSNWSLERGYRNLRDDDEIAYPYRVFGSGAQFSLQIILKVLNQDLDHLCSHGFHGFKVTFTDPTESLQHLRKYHNIALNRTTFFTISPRLTITSSTYIREYEPNARGCYMNAERHLRYFKHYSQRNCEMECVTNFTLAQCGCVKFSMPSEYQFVVHSTRFDLTNIFMLF